LRLEAGEGLRLVAAGGAVAAQIHLTVVIDIGFDHPAALAGAAQVQAPRGAPEVRFHLVQQSIQTSQ
jgi:hypothetical protein